MEGKRNVEWRLIDESEIKKVEGTVRRGVGMDRDLLIYELMNV